MHAIEKILAVASGKREVSPGEIVFARIDVAEVNDLYLQVIKSFIEIGGDRVYDPDRIVFVFDHYSPAPTINSAENHKKMREFCRKSGIKNLFDVGEGICHQVLIEGGFVGPGKVIVETDSHTTTLGALGAFATGVGSTDLALVMKTGKLWFKVPQVMRIKISGKPVPGIMAKDVILYILGKLKQDIAIYKAIEFCGEFVEGLCMDERLVLCNMAVEMGAKTAYIQPDSETYNYLKGMGISSDGFIEYKTDPDYEYASYYEFDVSSLIPQVSLPGSVDNVVDVSSCEGVEIDQIFVGTCTGGRLNDIRVLSEVLDGNKVKDGVRLIVIPASKRIFMEALKRGYVEKLLNAGAIFATPGCGPCLGAHAGVLASGERCLSTSSRNFPGRMGSVEAKIYLCSPMVAAFSALYGRITNPLRFL
ncbi:MAG: 3-isopropylmalate dehydratase large subunit [Synergistetes bacterium]|nr:3-isopropylmalate dehydratase large subunit [Synergistota bacterium]MDW8191699.1 3-isopropylmalate dehydratase large subunit [Synergistota bacterium]